MVSASDALSGGLRFESRSLCGHLLDLFSVVPRSIPWPHMEITNWLSPGNLSGVRVTSWISYLTLPLYTERKKVNSPVRQSKCFIYIA